MEILSHIDEIPYWDGESLPQIYFVRDSFNHIIPAIKIRDWSFFDALKQEDLLFGGYDWCFRGQANSEWLLESSLSRINKNCLIDNAVVAEQLRNFKNNPLGFFSEYNDLQLWVIGQHHGLHTPYLDWSHSHLIALYFAFEKENESSKYRSVFMLNSGKMKKSHKKNICFKSLQDVKVDDAGYFDRMLYQEGGLTRTYDYSPIEKIITGDYPNSSKYFCKIFIGNCRREQCLKFLFNENMGGETKIYPDILGIALECNRQILKKGMIVDPRKSLLIISKTVQDKNLINALSSILEKECSSKEINYNSLAQDIYSLRFELYKKLISGGVSHIEATHLVSKLLRAVTQTKN